MPVYVGVNVSIGLGVSISTAAITRLSLYILVVFQMLDSLDFP